MLRKSAALLCVIACSYSALVYAPPRKPRKNQKPAMVGSYTSNNGEWTSSYLYPNSIVTTLAGGIGDYCVNWVKLVDDGPNVNPQRLMPRNPNFPRYRALACRPDARGECRKVAECALDTMVGGKGPHPDYVPIPKNEIKYVEKDQEGRATGRTLEFDPSVGFEKQLTDNDDPRTFKWPDKYLDDKYAALFDIKNSNNETTYFCSLPLKITGDKSKPPTVDNVLFCYATMKEGKPSCPGVEECFKKKLPWTTAIMAQKGAMKNADREFARHAAPLSPTKVDRTHSQETF